ncbi:deoxynucleoside monophosphate kinase [Ruegeria phage RpAliso]|nr:deoxynucleoside monophosphate kinase [Ruegeria phage RpAliso]
MPTVYAFAGKRGAGKSTATSVLVDEMGFTDAKFADPLKNMLRAFYRTCGVEDAVIEEKIEGSLKETPCEWLRGKTPRHAMQTLGTEWRNLISEDLWAVILEKRIKRGDYGDKVAVSDLRFPGHEEEALRNLGAHVYRITRPESEKDDEAGKHSSETGIDKLKVNATLRNTGSIEDLKDYIRGLVEVNEVLTETGVIEAIIAAAKGRDVS